jgi:hypothetical protein
MAAGRNIESGRWASSSGERRRSAPPSSSTAQVAYRSSPPSSAAPAPAELGPGWRELEIDGVKYYVTSDRDLDELETALP